MCCSRVKSSPRWVAWVVAVGADLGRRRRLGCRRVRCVPWCPNKIFGRNLFILGQIIKEELRRITSSDIYHLNFTHATNTMSKLKDSCCIICNNNITDSSTISITDYMRPLSNSELSLYTFFQLISNFNQLDISEVPQNACDKCYQDALHVLDFQTLCNKAVENIKTNSEDIERVCVGIDCDVDILYSSEEDTEDGYDVDIITNNSDNAKDEDSASLLASEPAIRKRNRKPDSQARLEKIAERIECKQCHKLYRRDYMLKHMRVHTGEKLPIKICKCKLCPAEFKDASSLKYHMQNHSDERPYKCEICGKTFRHKVIHRSHYASHSDEWPFACLECPKKFRRNKTLKAHIVTQHAKNEPVECTFCGRQFTHKDGLRRHQTKSCHVLRNNDASLRP